MLLQNPIAQSLQGLTGQSRAQHYLPQYRKCINSINYAIINGDVNSTYPDSVGVFQIFAVAPGSYEVFAVPDSASGFNPSQKETVAISAGQVSETDTLKMTN